MIKAKTAKTYLLDDIVLRNARPSDKPVTLRDGGSLYAVIHPNGSIYFQVRYRLDGKARKAQLGKYPKLSLKQARLDAIKLKDGVSENIDPIVEKMKRKADSKLNAESTFEMIANDWLTLKASKVTEKYHQKISGMIKANTYVRLGKLPISGITSPMLLEALKVIEARGSVDLMHRVRALVAELFDYAKTIGRYAGENPADCLRRSVALEKHVVQHYQTLKSSEDVGAFLRRLPEYEGRIETQLLIKLQMMVATRPTEMRTATWDEFDFKTGLWTIKPERMKMGVEHVIPLPKQALVALKQLKTLTGYSQYLFPSPTKSGTLSEGTANKALKLLWPEYLIQPHGFRHLFSTHANEHDHQQKDIIEAALAHRDTNRIRATYNKATYLKERLALAQWYADYLDELKAGAKVIPFKQA